MNAVNILTNLELLIDEYREGRCTSVDLADELLLRSQREIRPFLDAEIEAAVNDKVNREDREEIDRLDGIEAEYEARGEEAPLSIRKN